MHREILERLRACVAQHRRLLVLEDADGLPELTADLDALEAALIEQTLWLQERELRKAVKVRSVLRRDVCGPISTGALGS